MQLRIRRYCSLFITLVFVACAGAGIKQSINTGIKTADVYVVQTTQLLDAGAITSSVAQARLDIIKQAKSGLQAAATAETSCTTQVLTPTACNDAQRAYDAANALLNATLTWLIQHGKTGK